jgi:hypothetical protein
MTKARKSPSKVLEASYPHLDLDCIPDGDGWVVGSTDTGKPLTEQEAMAVVVAYEVMRQLSRGPQT